MGDKAATSLTVWKAALSIVTILVGTAGAGAYFLAGLEGGVAANVTAIIAVEDDLSEHSSVAASRFTASSGRTRALEITNATYEAKLDGLAGQLDRIEALIRGNSR